ncbi:PRTRC system protein E [Trinickia dinghuensis]|uniref:PRTRC system protein E n=1 Tax=Trinickia dinghuensis TaxID=2291023 RepID=A0A3D8K2T6_9BURK|nr:PRTRC system protein E [Trinickia dinghuensis]RDU99185.1 PRTRC system protein E [Trinickia dinghuensis]
MSLFKSLYPLAQNTSLTILIVAEGEQLRVNVMPRSKDEKAEKTLYPLSLLARPEELDRDFAEALEIYAPGSQSVLEQARAASAANGSSNPPALPAPSGTPAKGKRGPKPKATALPPAQAAAADAAPVKSEGNADERPAADPRQSGLPGLEAEPAAAMPDSQDMREADNSEAPSEADDSGIDLL